MIKTMITRQSIFLVITSLFVIGCMPRSSQSPRTNETLVLAESSATPKPIYTVTQVAITKTASPTMQVPSPEPLIPLALGMAFTYNEAQGHVTAFGGQQYGTCNFCTDTWVWDFTTWTKAQPPNHPEGRMGASFVYDPVHKMSLLFGGLGSDERLNVFLGDTWLWNGLDWQKQTPPVSPPPRAGAVMAYDENLQAILLFGGMTTGTSRAPTILNDTWIWNGQTWMELHPATQPPAADGSPISMAYDKTHQNMVLLDQGTWIWDGQNWAEVSPENHPDYHTRSIMGYDSTHQQLISFGVDLGTSNVTASTWIWDGTNWISAPTPAQLNRVGEQGLIDDPVHKVLLLFVTGFNKGISSSSAWAWDGMKWHQIY